LIIKKEEIFMARIGVGKIMVVGGSLAIRLPSVILKDSGFVFSDKDEVVVRIVGNKLMIEKA
jgi:antitoxin component of MazEF toxin-antitoxin module